MKAGALAGQFENVDGADRPERLVAYLDAADALPAVRAYRARMLELLGPRPGESLLEVGCGAGDFCRRLAERVGPRGRVMGIDASEVMIGQARQRGRACPQLALRTGDAHALDDIPDATFDGASADRVFQHLESPHEALAELVRVCRPGGRIVISEPDWGTLAVDVSDPALARKVSNLISDGVCQGWIGRRLPALMREAGLVEVQVEANTVILDRLQDADSLLGLSAAALRGYERGLLTPEETARWLAGLQNAEERSRFFCSLTGFTVHGRLRGADPWPPG